MTTTALPAAGKGTARLLTPTGRPPTPPDHEPDAPRGRWAWLALAAIGVLIAMVLGFVLLIAGVATKDTCPPADRGLPDGFNRTVSLGGVDGTGFTGRQISTVRTSSPYAGSRLAPGRYSATAYGPPWGGIQGTGLATSGGIVLAGGAPRLYMVAVDPMQIAHGQLVYVWPNPFGWRGPFLAADTGSAIKRHRIDFYDWRGRTTQLRWAQRDVQVSAGPTPGGPDLTSNLGPTALRCGAGALASGEVGDQIGQIARSHLAAGPSIRGFQPPSVDYAWCAWFLTNAWRTAGVPIPVNGWSGYPYTWAQSRGQLFKAVGQPPKSSTPPAGSALMYGSTPRPGGDSRHVNLVDRVLADGSFMVTGGNQDDGRVTRYGPCRLRRADPARLVGPGCDTRPIYGIATPTSGQEA